jgi:2-polyprenyl-6-methoxyphenol hydroxylase-like FAD-dependent oxidoreductase
MDVTDVLVVGAGPTGLALAAVAHAHGASVRVIDRNPSAVHESRALVLQPRTLELLAGLGLRDELLSKGRRTVRLVLHSGPRCVAVPVFDVGIEDTPYPFLLFISQAETEAALTAHLTHRGVTIERGTELLALDQQDARVTCQLKTAGGAETVEAAYAVGCDGAASTVRRLLGIGFTGGRYPQRFALADVHVDGDLPPDRIHAFLSRRGIMFLFPLGQPAPWRVIGMLPSDQPDEDLTLPAVQAIVDEFAGGGLRLRDPVWVSDFRLRHRLADRYRSGRVFLAGDAAHVHSPAGGQGMNVGIQDAVNLGWKLAMVARGTASRDLLDSYEHERRPVGGALLRFTDRLFTLATTTRPPISTIRATIAPYALPVATRLRPLRAAAFRRIAELDVTYRHSPAVQDARSARRPAAGDRLPDAHTHNGTLHSLIASPGFHLLLAGPVDDVAHPVLAVHRLEPGEQAWTTLRVRTVAQILVRPDGHIAYRADEADTAGLHDYLNRWLPSTAG